MRNPALVDNLSESAEWLELDLPNESFWSIQTTGSNITKKMVWWKYFCNNYKKYYKNNISRNYLVIISNMTVNNFMGIWPSLIKFCCKVEHGVR